MKLKALALILPCLLAACGPTLSETPVTTSERAAPVQAAAPASTQTPVRVLSVVVTGSGKTIEVKGEGFRAETVVNFFAQTSSGSRNLGGVDSSGRPRIAIRLAGPDRLTFDRPAEALAGPAYVMVLNPPFSPADSSGDGPAGALTLP